MKRPSVHLNAIVACLFAVAALVASPAQPGQAEWTFISFVVPGGLGAFPLDVNARGDIVGRYGTGDGRTHGFLRTVDGTFTTIDYPGAAVTVAFGINSEGVIVGSYTMAPEGPLVERHGFLLRDGVFIPVDPPGSKFTNPLGINAEGDVVGRFCTALPCNPPGGGNYHGFRWRDGETVVIDVPDSRETNAWKISPEGDVVGAFRDPGGPNRLFLLQGDQFTLFDLPGLLPLTQDNGGANSRGDIVGTYCDVAPCRLSTPGTHGFLLRRGELTTIDVPGAEATAAIAINASGDITGAYRDVNGGNHGYLLTRKY